MLHFICPFYSNINWLLFRPIEWSQNSSVFPFSDRSKPVIIRQPLNVYWASLAHSYVLAWHLRCQHFQLPWAKGSGSAYRMIGWLASSSFSTFKGLLLWNRRADLNEISYAASWKGGNAHLFKCSCHMTKIAAMPIYDKNLQKSSSSDPVGWYTWNLVCSIKFAKLMTGLTMTHFKARSNLVH